MSIFELNKSPLLSSKIILEEVRTNTLLNEPLKKFLEPFSDLDQAINQLVKHILSEAIQEIKNHPELCQALANKGMTPEDCLSIHTYLLTTKVKEAVEAISKKP